MITTLRHLFVDSWVGRAAAILIFLAFIGWGVGDVYSNMGSSGTNAITRIGNRNVTPDDLSRALDAQLPQIAHQMGLPDASALPQSARDQAARQALQELIARNEVQLAAERAGMVVPDAVVRQEIFSIPAFHNASGQFDRKLFNQRIARIGMTEGHLIELIRGDIAATSLLQGMGQSVQVPASLTDRLMAFNTRERVFDAVHIVPAGQSAIQPPTDAVLHRYYDNHPWDFRAPEYRHTRIVVLTADSVAKSIDVPNDVLRRVYDAEQRKYDVPETRSIQVLTFPNQVAAQAAADAWKKNASWADLQHQHADAAAVALADIRKTDIPNPELAQAAFAAAPNEVQGPTSTSNGWVVFRILGVTPPHKTSFDAAKAEIIDLVRKQEAPGALQAREKEFQDAVAGSTDLEHIPSNIGAVPLAGAMDAQGMTRSGEPAPIPGSDALRKAIIARVFSQAKNAQPVAVQGPDGSAFAVLVDDVQPGASRPFDSVRAEVLEHWQAEQARRVANERATSLFVSAKAASLAKALSGQPESATALRDVAVSRVHPDKSLPDAVFRAVLAATPGKTIMLDQPDGFWLVDVTSERPAPAGTDATALQTQLHDQYRASMQGDIPVALNAAFERETPPKALNLALFNQVVAATAPAVSHP